MRLLYHCLIVPTILIVCAIAGTSLAFGICYALAKNPGKYGPVIFDANGTFIYEKFKEGFAVVMPIFSVSFTAIFSIFSFIAYAYIVEYYDNKDNSDHPTDPIIDSTTSSDSLDADDIALETDITSDISTSESGN